MDIEKLKRCLKCCADDNSKACNKCELEYGEEECQNLCGYAATALSTLQAENEKLRDEVERQRRSADNRQHLYENAERAYMKVLAELEQGQGGMQNSECRMQNEPPAQVSLMDLGGQTVLKKLRMTDVNILSPIEALNLLAELKQDLNG